MALLEKKKREQEENIIDVLETIPFQLDCSDNFADHEDNDDEYHFDEEEESKEQESSDRDSDMGSIIPVCDTSFNQ